MYPTISPGCVCHPVSEGDSNSAMAVTAWRPRTDRSRCSRTFSDASPLTSDMKCPVAPGLNTRPTHGTAPSPREDARPQSACAHRPHFKQLRPLRTGTPFDIQFAQVGESQESPWAVEMTGPPPRKRESRMKNGIFSALLTVGLASSAFAGDRSDLQVFNDVSKQVNRYSYFTIFDSVHTNID